MEEQLSLPQESYAESPEQEMIRGELYGKPEIIVRFYIGASRAPNDEDGAPVFNEKVCVHIQVPDEMSGRVLNAVTRDMEEQDKQLYPREWKLFVDNCKAERPIPLTALPKMRPPIIKALESLGIHTVQELNAKDVPGYLNKWKPWARYLVALHEQADSNAKPRVKLVA